MPSGPCFLCGDTDYPRSLGGEMICPSCDCGHEPRSTTVALRAQAAAADAARAKAEEERDTAFAKYGKAWDTIKYAAKVGADLRAQLDEATAKADRYLGIIHADSLTEGVGLCTTCERTWPLPAGVQPKDSPCPWCEVSKLEAYITLLRRNLRTRANHLRRIQREMTEAVGAPTTRDLAVCGRALRARVKALEFELNTLRARDASKTREALRIERDEAVAALAAGRRIIARELLEEAATALDSRAAAGMGEGVGLPCYCADTHIHNCPRHQHLQDEER